MEKTTDLEETKEKPSEKNIISGRCFSRFLFFVSCGLLRRWSLEEFLLAPTGEASLSQHYFPRAQRHSSPGAGILLPGIVF